MGVEQGDTKPPFLAGFDGEAAFVRTAVSFQGGNGEWFTAVHVVDGGRGSGVYLLEDVEEGGVGQVALGGPDTAVLGGDEADDKSVEVGRLEIGNW